MAGATVASGSSVHAAKSKTKVVAVRDDFYKPATLKIKKGTTVRWTNASSVQHTVTSGASSQLLDKPGAVFDAPLAPGGTFQFTFNQVGVYPYFCRFHEGMGMKGRVKVLP